MHQMMACLMVGAGGAIGSMLRFGVNRLVLDGWPALRFPLATLIVNVVGSGVFGVLAGLLASGRHSLQPQWREFVFAGVLGGFTTFSAFAGDVVLLSREGLSSIAIANVFANFVLAISALYIGLLIGLRSA
jgi:fluoride exporter